MNSKILLLLALFLMLSNHVFSQDAKKYTTYVVKSGETLKSIAKKIGCKTKEIRDLNPDVDKKNPVANTTLVIPNTNFNKPIIKNETQALVKVVVHEVKEGETFYGIAKEYNVTIQSIKDANPTTVDGLKTGQKIRIPSENEFTVQPKKGKVVLYKVNKGDTKWRIATIHNISVAELENLNPNLYGELQENQNIWVPIKPEVPEEVKETYMQKQEDIYIYHTVQQGEGLFRIAVIYDTTQEEIERLNPEATKKLRPGMLLKIPGKKKSNFLIHEVIKGDTFYNITRRYGINETDLIAANPELTDGLKIGMKLKIIPIEKTSIPVPENQLSEDVSTVKTLHLSFLMPLKAKEEVDYNSKTNSQLRTICTDFYMGAEIAIDSLRKQGLSVEYHIYDTNNDPLQLYQLVNDTKLKKSDALIGPFFFENAQRIAKELPETPIITPLYSKKQVLDTHNNLIKAAVDSEKVIDYLVAYLKKSYNNQKIIIVTDKEKTNVNIASKIKLSLLEHESISNVQVIEPTHNKKETTDLYMSKRELEQAIVPKKDTWIILVSDNTIVTSDTVNTFGLMANENAIQLFTIKIFDDFDHMNFQYLGEMNWSFPTTQFDNLYSSSVDDFKKKFYELNKEYPSQYAFTGFDLTYDSLIRLANSNNLYEGLEAGISQRLSHKYNYEKTEKGYINKGVFMVSLNKDIEFTLLD